MKVLCIFNQPDLPEARLLCELKRNGAEILVFCDVNAAHQELLYEAGINIRYVRLRSKFSLPAILLLRKVIVREQPDIVHAFSARALSNLLFAVCGLRNRPRILAYRGVVGNVSRLDPTSWLSYLHPKVDAISCVSEAVMRYLKNIGVSEKKLHTIYKGHDVSWYNHLQPNVSRKELGIEDDVIIIGCVANMRKSKGMDVLFSSLEKLPNDLKLHVLLIGEMQIPESLKQNRNVTALGFRKDAQSLMKLFDIIVVPSRSEGLPKALLEAMSQGVAAIVTNAGGMPEIVNDGQEGRVVQVEDVDALKTAIEEVVCNKALLSKFKMAARKKIETKFSINNTVAQTSLLYESLINSSLVH